MTGVQDLSWTLLHIDPFIGTLFHPVLPHSRNPLGWMQGYVRGLVNGMEIEDGHVKKGSGAGSWRCCPEVCSMPSLCCQHLSTFTQATVSCVSCDLLLNALLMETTQCWGALLGLCTGPFQTGWGCICRLLQSQHLLVLNTWEQESWKI